MIDNVRVFIVFSTRQKIRERVNEFAYIHSQIPKSAFYIDPTLVGVVSQNITSAVLISEENNLTTLQR